MFEIGTGPPMDWQWSQRSCKFLYFCSCPVLSCISFVSCIFLYLRLLLITAYLSTSLLCCLPMGQTWTRLSRIWSRKNWPTVIFLWWLTLGHAICTNYTMHLWKVSQLLEYCRDTVMPNKCGEIGFWSPVRCPVFFSDCAGITGLVLTSVHQDWLWSRDRTELRSETLIVFG